MKFHILDFLILFGIGLSVEGFSWKTCGDPSESVKVTSLDVYSNGTKILLVTGRGKVAADIKGPVQAEMVMKKKFFWGWTVLPCVDQIGSCTYEDVCKFGIDSDTPCPSEYVDNNIPCRCPILQGSYSVKKFPIDLNVLPNWIEEGKYRILLKLNHQQKEILCLDIYLEF